MREQVLAYVIAHPGCNAADVADALGTTPEQAAAFIDDLLECGELELA